ncbi:hypothetical protein LXL04_036493 [Taraxacum kok-saghyz]
MVGQRSSLRLRKLTTRMPNTVESSAMSDEDNDFVNPGPPDKTFTPKKTSGSGSSSLQKGKTRTEPHVEKEKDGSCSNVVLKGKSAAEVGSKKRHMKLEKRRFNRNNRKKNDKPTKPEKEKKVESRYTAHIHRLATRMSPTRLCEAVRMMRNLKNDVV